MNTKLVFASGGSALTTISLLLCSAPTWAVGDPVRGATIFQACAAYHSTTPGEHMTGPSLAKIWQRKAGMVEGFARYSEAMKHVDLVWTDARDASLCQAVSDYRAQRYAGSKTAVPPNPDKACPTSFGNTDTEFAPVNY